MMWFIDRKPSFAFGLALVTLGGIAILSCLTVLRVKDTADQVKHTQQVLAQIERVLSRLKDAELGQRGYLLTGRENYLQPYHTAIATLNSEIATLKYLAKNNPSLQHSITELEPLVSHKLTELQQTIALRQQNRTQTALKIVETDQGKETMDEIRIVMAAMRNQELQQLSRRSQIEQLALTQTIVLISSAILLEIILLAVIIVRFNRHMYQLQQTQEALTISENRFQVAIKGSPITVFHQDADLRYTWVYNALPEFDAQEIIGKQDTDFLAPEIAQHRIALKQHILNTGIGVRREVAIQLGTMTRYFDLILEPLRNSDHNVVGITGTAIDISDRKCAEDTLKQSEEQLRSALIEKEILLREIHHRVKNNLQIISGLLQLQAQNTTDLLLRMMLKEAHNRVESMSIIHKKLYTDSNWKQINIADYIESLTSNLLSSYSIVPGAINLQVQLDAIALNLDQAIPCGLIINELVSNALKYAFPNSGTGKIGINLHQIESNSIELVVWDDGIGLAKDFEWEKTDTLGLSLVHALVIEQLEGEVSFSLDQGTLFRIVFQNGQTSDEFN